MASTTPGSFVQRRLMNQRIQASRCSTVADVVTTLGAVQAQDYDSALWAIGLRLPGSTVADVERAIQDRQIVRTWPMRGTLHFIPAPDIRWMLSLFTPRLIAGTATRVKQLELTEAIFGRAERSLTKALRGNRILTREGVMQELASAKICTAEGRGYHILYRLAMRGVICHGPRAGKQQTFALLDEWIPTSRSMDRDAALVELARRYFNGHGPATLQDFVWWSGAKVTEARTALQALRTELECHVLEGVEYWQVPVSSGSGEGEAHLLPGFDEYLLGYRNRQAVLEESHAGLVVPGGNGMFLPIMVNDGRIVGIWKRTVLKNSVRISLQPFAPLSKRTRNRFAKAADRYGAYLGRTAALDAGSPGSPGALHQTESIS